MIAKQFEGKKLPDVLDNIKMNYSKFRIIKLGEAQTLSDDFISDRLNIYVDSDDVIKIVDLG